MQYLILNRKFHILVKLLPRNSCCHSGNFRLVLFLNYFKIPDPLLIVLEYLPYGDLLGYLRKSRGIEDPYNTGEKRPNSRVSEKDMLSFAWMIADGMKYLATMKVNHTTVNSSTLSLALIRGTLVTGLDRDNFSMILLSSKAKLP